MADAFSRAYELKWVFFGIALSLLLLWVAWPFLNVIVYAVFLYYITRPIKRYLCKYVKNESLLVTASLLVLALPLIIIIAYTLLVGLSQFNALTSATGLTSSIPGGPLANLSQNVADWQRQLNLDNLTFDSLLHASEQEWYKMLTQNLGSIQSIQQVVMATGSTIIDIAFKLLLMFMIAFFLLRDDDKLVSWGKSAFPRMVSEHEGVLPRYLKAVDTDLDKIFFGNLISIVFFAIVAVVVFNIINLFVPDPSFRIPYATLLGILCGVSALMPVVGQWLVLGPLLIYVLISTGLAGTLLPNLGFFILMVLAIIILVELLPDFVIRPFISKGQVHTGLLMFAYVLGPVVFGIAGLFIGAIVLVFLTNYFRIVVPQLTKEADNVEQAVKI